MTLFELGIAYTEINVDILKLRTRNTILEALRLYGGGYASECLKKRTSYQQRRQREVHSELSHRGFITIDDGIPAPVKLMQHKKVAVPTYVSWSDLSFSEIKTLVALYSLARNKRSPYFTYEGKREELATVAGLNRKATGQALASLAAKGLCTWKAVRDGGSRSTRGTEVQLLDARSRASLNSRAWFFRDRMNNLEPVERYKLALKGYDSRQQLEDIRGYIRGFQCLCPFCDRAERTFRFSATEDEDVWQCFRCGRKGDSISLWTLRSFWIWKEIPMRASMAVIADATGCSPVDSPLLAPHEYQAAA